MISLDRKYAFPGNEVLYTKAPHRNKLVAIVEVTFPPGIIRARLVVKDDAHPEGGEEVQGTLDDFEACATDSCHGPKSQSGG